MGRRKLSGFQSYLTDFQEWMAARNYSALTVRHRGYDLGHFFGWARDRNIFEPSEVTRPIVEQFRRWLSVKKKANGLPLSFATQSLRLGALKAFFKWLAKNNHILYNPVAELEMPRRGRALPKDILSIDEVASIFAQPDLGTCTGVRDRCILEILYSTGARRFEVAGLGITDVNQNSGTMTIRQGKGQKDRIVPIGDQALAWVDRYLMEARPMLVVEPDREKLFVSHRGKALKPRALGEIVRRYIEAAGVKKEGSCHLFRHTMATLMLENGADIRFIQEMLGHAELSTTQIYTRVSIRKLKEIHEKTHPGII